MAKTALKRSRSVLSRSVMVVIGGTVSGGCQADSAWSEAATGSHFLTQVPRFRKLKQPLRYYSQRWRSAGISNIIKSRRHESHNFPKVGMVGCLDFLSGTLLLVTPTDDLNHSFPGLPVYSFVLNSLHCRSSRQRSELDRLAGTDISIGSSKPDWACRRAMECFSTRKSSTPFIR